jgi:predicted anti-sigma-YlaC factor YlaD
MKRYNWHPELDDLELSLLNRLSHAEQFQVQSHLRECERCRKMSTALNAQIEIIRRTLRSEQLELATVN